MLDGVLAWIDCQVHRAHPGGDHRIVVARVLDLETRTHGRPLIFFQTGFQRML